MTISERMPYESARDYARRIIKNNIISLQLAPGSRINDQEIAAELGLSRTPVREDWSQKHPNETDINRYNRVMEMQRFSRYLVEQGFPSYLTDVKPVKHSTHTPYIFTEDGILRIFQVVDTLEPCASVPSRHLVMPVLFRMLYGCGLRISEALDLHLANVDLENGVIRIQNGKNLFPCLNHSQCGAKSTLRMFWQEKTQIHPSFVEDWGTHIPGLE